MPDNPLAEEPFPNIQSKPYHQNFRPFPWVLSMVTTVKGSVPAPPPPLVRKVEIVMRPLLNLLFSWLNRSNYLSHSSHSFSRLFIIFVFLLWMLCLISFLYCCDTYADNIQGEATCLRYLRLASLSSASIIKIV